MIDNSLKEQLTLILQDRLRSQINLIVDNLLIDFERQVRRELENQALKIALNVALELSHNKIDSTLQIKLKNNEVSE